MARETIAVLRSCRDHWKTSFEHERANVIRLRGLLAEQHAIHYEMRGGECECEDCKLVRQKSPGVAIMAYAAVPDPFPLLVKSGGLIQG